MSAGQGDRKASDLSASVAVEREAPTYVAREIEDARSVVQVDPHPERWDAPARDVPPVVNYDATREVVETVRDVVEHVLPVVEGTFSAVGTAVSMLTTFQDAGGPERDPRVDAEVAARQREEARAGSESTAFYSSGDRASDRDNSSGGDNNSSGGCVIS